MNTGAVENLPPIHPGQFVRDDLDELGLSARKFADHIGVAPNAITGILNGERGISAAMALRFGKAFGTGPDYWMRLQDLYEKKLAQAELGEKLQAIRQLNDVA